MQQNKKGGFSLLFCDYVLKNYRVILVHDIVDKIVDLGATYAVCWR